MANNDDESLGDQDTFGDRELSSATAKSLGDEVTLSGGDTAGGELHDDGIEIQDLTTRYTTEGVLGKGGMGEVLLATDQRLNRKVAIKRMLGGAARSKTAIRRFLTEARSIAALNHPNVVQIYDYGQTNDGPFLIMEFVEGRSLLDLCQEGAVSVEEAVDLICQLCDGLSRAHAANIIHRDIKPANILLTVDSVPKLTDFGLAKDESADTGMTMAGAVLGTLDFMPPEQRRDAALTDARSDLWSLAATLYQMVTGKSPRIIKFNNVPNSLQDVLGKALEDEQDDRYQTAIELRDALKASLRNATPILTPGEELHTGECAKCRTHNESSRKFCRECAASLRASCLKCETEIPVWDKVCGECGAKQPELIATRLEAMQQDRDRAEQLRSQYSFESALQIAEDVASVEDERISQFKPWADEFLESIKGEWRREQEASRTHFSEATKHREAFDYQAAIHAIESIPEPMRSSDATSLLQRLESDLAESRDLIQAIEYRIKRRDLDGLLKQVDRAVELQGNREDLQKLQGQLRSREAKLTAQRDEAYAKAEELIAAGKAKTAHDLLRRIDTKRLTSAQKRLMRQIELMVDSEDELLGLLQEANADGGIDPEELVALFAKTLECLSLNPNHTKIRQLLDDLCSRLRKAIKYRLIKPTSFEVFGVTENDARIPADIRQFLIPIPRPIRELRKRPGRRDQISILMGQILRPGANLVSQLNAIGEIPANQVTRTTD